MDLDREPFTVNGAMNQAVWDLQKSLEGGGMVSEATATKILELTKKALRFIRDDAYSSVWIVLLDWLAQCETSPEVSEMYRRIDDLQPLFYDSEETVPGDVVSHLWLMHLPSLELAVLNLIRSITINGSFRVFSCTVDNTLQRSHLLRVASQEPLIYKTICRMLASYLKQTTYSRPMVDIVAKFCRAVQQSPCAAVRHEKLSLQDGPSYCSDLARFFSVLSPGNSKKSDAEVIARMFLCWRKCREKAFICHCQESKTHLNENNEDENNIFGTPMTVEDDIKEDLSSACSRKKSTESCDATDSVRVDILLNQAWMLTIEFRSWVVAAMNAVMVCDYKNVTACLWLMIAHSKIDFLSEVFDEMRSACLSMVHQLRGLMGASEVDDRVGLSLSQLSGTQKNLQSRYKSGQFLDESILSKYNSIFDQLLMVFLIQSHCIFSLEAWKTILNFVTKSTEAHAHLYCLVDHVHSMDMTFKDWEPRKKAIFRVRLEDLVENLHETENHLDKKILFKELNKIFELLN